MGMRTVALSEAEAVAAASLGRKREELRVSRGKAQNFHTLDRGGSMIARNEIGAIAEYALARYFGKDTLRDWCENKAFSLNHQKIKADVGVNLHVRSTALAHGRLVAHGYDPDDGVFVLARVSGRVVTFVGWMIGQKCKSPEYWLDVGPGFGKRPAYVVPADHLLDFDTIPHEAIYADR